jgi:hypothetical protein
VAEPPFGSASLAELDRVRDELGLAGVTFHAGSRAYRQTTAWSSA